ncbi:MAG TPA: CHRD domain-containing protein [Polyangiaceae bacterium]|nr:CHRD domain-containing protein [Polyangiaceae bacterium]
MAIVPFLAALGGCSSSGAGAPVQSSSSDAGGGVDGPYGVTTGDDSGDNGGGDDGGSGAIVYEADLAGAQVVPVVTTGASGTGTFALSADGTTLTYKITMSPAGFAPTAVNLHLGAVGENTGTTHQLTPVSTNMSGQVALTMDEQGAITSDQLYVDVPTQAYPNGELRGQLTLVGAEIFVAVPTGAQQVPQTASAYTAHASFILSPDQGTLIYHVATTATPTDVRLHRGIGGINGQVAYDLPVGNGLPTDGTLQIGGTTGNSDPTDLENGRFYLNIVTQQNPAGELRGQLLHPGEALFTGVLSGANEVPPIVSQATGGAQFILSADQSSAKYEAVVNGVIPIGAEIDQGQAGQKGPLLDQLTLDQTGALGTVNTSASDVQALFSGGVFINVKTPSYASGELRAQLINR